MKTNNKYILIILIIFFTNILNTSYSENIDKMYEKIDLFSEVLEKIQNEYVDEINQFSHKVHQHFENRLYLEYLKILLKLLLEQI